MVVADKKHGRDYIEQVARYHTSGQLKIAPEHSEAVVLRLMGKPSPRRYKTSNTVRRDFQSSGKEAIPDLLPDRCLSRLFRCRDGKAAPIREP